MLIIAFASFSFVMRLVPHPANLIPVGAFALFVGVFVKSKWAIVIPVFVMVISDLVIGTHNLILFTWGSLLLFTVIGWMIRKGGTMRTVEGALSGSVLFYLITNYAVWQFTPLYSKTFGGLMQSYMMALPFFRNSLVGNLFYTAVFFSIYYVLEAAITRNESKQQSLAYSKERLQNR